MNVFLYSHEKTMASYIICKMCKEIEQTLNWTCSLSKRAIVAYYWIRIRRINSSVSLVKDVRICGAVSYILAKGCKDIFGPQSGSFTELRL